MGGPAMTPCLDEPTLTIAYGWLDVEPAATQRQDVRTERLRQALVCCGAVRSTVRWSYACGAPATTASCLPIATGGAMTTWRSRCRATGARS